MLVPPPSCNAYILAIVVKLFKRGDGGNADRPEHLMERSEIRAGM